MLLTIDGVQYCAFYLALGYRLPEQNAAAWIQRAEDFSMWIIVILASRVCVASG